MLKLKTKILEANDKNIIDLFPDQDKVCFVIKQAFSNEECDQFVLNKIFKKANTHYPTYYRNNDRLVVDDLQLSQKLFDKIKENIPQLVEINNQDQIEQWHLKKLNSRIRFCRYLPDQYFNKHLDGVYYESTDSQSILTFMLYLNGKEDFTGGRTLFFEDKFNDQIIKEFLPEKGDLIIFDHNLWHSGEKLVSGEKYILRSDIIYEKFSTVNENNLPFSEGHLGYIWKLTNFKISSKDLNQSLKNELIISAGRDKKIKVWDKQGKLIQSLEGHHNSIVDLIQLNNQLLISSSRDQTIRFWNYEKNNFKCIKVLTLNDVTILSLSKINDQTFLSADSNGTINLISDQGVIIKSWQAHKEWIWKIIKITEDIIISAGEDGLIKIWQLSLNKQILEYNHQLPVISMFFDQKNNLIYIGDYSGNITILSLDNNQLIKIKEINHAHKGIIRDILINNEKIISCGEDSLIKIWDINNLSLIKEFKHNNFVQSLVINDNNLVSASYDGQIKVWSLLN